jgi:hypothetical protein
MSSTFNEKLLSTQAKEVTDDLTIFCTLRSSHVKVSRKYVGEIDQTIV